MASDSGSSTNAQLQQQQDPFSNLKRLLGDCYRTFQGAFRDFRNSAAENLNERVQNLSNAFQNPSASQKYRLEMGGSMLRSPLYGKNFAAVIPGDSVAEIVVTTGILNFLNIYNTLLIGRLILTWFPNPPSIIANPLSTICDPYLNLFRGIIPPLGGSLDFSPILAFLTLNVFTNAATALPCELPSTRGVPAKRIPNFLNKKKVEQQKSTDGGPLMF